MKPRRRLTASQVNFVCDLALLALELGYSSPTVGRWLAAGGHVGSVAVGERLARQVADEQARQRRAAVVARLPEVAARIDRELAELPPQRAAA